MCCYSVSGNKELFGAVGCVCACREWLCAGVDNDTLRGSTSDDLLYGNYRQAQYTHDMSLLSSETGVIYGATLNILRREHVEDVLAGGNDRLFGKNALQRNDLTRRMAT